MSKKDFIKLKIKVPNYEDQIRISKILDHSQLHIDTAKEKLTKLQEKKK
jgi:restriction endonuclease S subunit